MIPIKTGAKVSSATFFEDGINGLCSIIVPYFISTLKGVSQAQTLAGERDLGKKIQSFNGFDWGFDLT